MSGTYPTLSTKQHYIKKGSIGHFTIDNTSFVVYCVDSNTYPEDVIG